MNFKLRLNVQHEANGKYRHNEKMRSLTRKKYVTNSARRNARIRLLVIITMTCFFVILCLSLARVTASGTRLNGYLEEELQEMFEEWMIEHNKSYHSLEEKNKKFQIYKNTVKASKNYDPFFHPPRVKGLADLTWAEIAGSNNRAKARMLMKAFNPKRGVPFVG